MKAKGCPYSLPSLETACTRIKVDEAVDRILHDFQDMGMAADENIGAIPLDKLSGMGFPMPWRAADMGHEDFHALAGPEKVFRIIVEKYPVITVSRDPLERLEGGYFGRSDKAAAEIARMPELVNRFEKLPERGIETAVGVGKKTDKHLTQSLMNIFFR